MYRNIVSLAQGLQNFMSGLSWTYGRASACFTLVLHQVVFGFLWFFFFFILLVHHLAFNVQKRHGCRA